MFRKPFTVKDNSNARNSKKRMVLSRIQNSHVINSLSKLQASRLKMINFHGVSITLYLFDKEPLLFEIDRNTTILPTVYFAWKFPNSFPTLFIGEPVMDYLSNGADLMLPGVVLLNELPFPNFVQGAAVCIATVTKEGKICGPLAVGRALMSSESMLTSGLKGRGVEIVHTYKDHLWESGSQMQAPLFEINDFIVKAHASDEDTKDLLSSDSVEPNAFEISELKESLPEEQIGVIFNDDPELMENLLTQTFFSALKYKVAKDMNFPYDVGNFYADFILKSLPSNQKIELKKTKYKKFNNFLNMINKNDNGWIVKTKNGKNDIDLIQEINWDHPSIQHAEPLASTANEATNESKVHIRISECFSVTEIVLEILRKSGGTYRKGDIIQTNELRTALLNYAKKMNLEKDGKIQLDDTLQTLIKHFLPDVMPLNDILQKVSNLMSKAFMITTLDGKIIIRRNKIPNITFQIEKRAGNKVVTLVNNLSVFGIDPKNIAPQVQNGAATGATIVQSAANCEGAQLLIHGNHVNFVGDLLDEYGLNKKYIKGLELGVKKKGKK